MATINPDELWALLPASLRRQIVGELAAILGEIHHEIGTGSGRASGEESSRLYPAVDASPGCKQSGEPPNAVRAPRARPRTGLA